MIEIKRLGMLGEKLGYLVWTAPISISITYLENDSEKCKIRKVNNFHAKKAL
jgi:hypothetical protein